MKQPIDTYIDGKLVEKFKPKRRNKGASVSKKRVREIYRKERPEWLIGSFEEYQEIKKRKG